MMNKVRREIFEIPPNAAPADVLKLPMVASMSPERYTSNPVATISTNYDGISV